MFRDNGAADTEGVFEELTSLQSLWREVALYPSGESTAAVRVFLERVCVLMGANDASWMAVRRHDRFPRGLSGDRYQTLIEEIDGWIPTAAVYLNSKKDLNEELDRWFMHARKEGVDPMTQAMLRSVGEARTYIWNDVVTDDDCYEHWLPKKYLSFYGVGERMAAMVPVNDDCESCIMIDRSVGAEPFNSSHRRFLHHAVAGISQLSRCLCLERGMLNSSNQLSNREVDTYRMLLTGMSEGEIAAQMKLSSHTVHDYARHLYKKFEVKGRVGLLALVLGA